MDWVLNYQLHPGVIPRKCGGETGHGGVDTFGKSTCKTWSPILETVPVLFSPSLGRQRHWNMDLCRVKQPSPSLFPSSSWAVRRRKWDFTCPCVLVIGGMIREITLYQQQTWLIVWIAFVSPMWAPRQKQDLNSYSFYFSSLEFSCKESVS